jgi:hypothetical protein
MLRTCACVRVSHQDYMDVSHGLRSDDQTLMSVASLKTDFSGEMCLPPLSAHVCFGCYVRVRVGCRVSQVEWLMMRAYSLGACSRDEIVLHLGVCFEKPPL